MELLVYNNMKDENMDFFNSLINQQVPQANLAILQDSQNDHNIPANANTEGIGNDPIPNEINIQSDASDDYPQQSSPAQYIGQAHVPQTMWYQTNRSSPHRPGPPERKFDQQLGGSGEYRPDDETPPIVRRMSAVEQRIVPGDGQYLGFPDLTTMVNSTNISIPVETQFVDRFKCSICGKKIQRDMQRHIRTHHLESRFKCCFPLQQCNHKSRKFNRPYDYKKHLLNKHFMFDDDYVKRFHNLSDKLGKWGVCPCGKRFISDDWLDHVSRKDDQRCALTREA